MNPLFLLLPLAAPAQGGLELVDFLPSVQDEQRYGASFADLGDIDFDGVSDFAIGSPGFVPAAWSWGGGQVEVRSGADRSLLYTVDPIAGVDSLLGLKLMTIGDIDHDGAKDFFVGAGGHEAGYLISSRTGFRMYTVETYSLGQVGMEVTLVGDVNGDNLPEFAIGLPFEVVDGKTAAGRLLLCDGATGLVLKEHHGSVRHQRMGAILCGPGDLDGDGIPDLLSSGVDGASFAGEGVTAYSGTDLQEIMALSRHTLRLDICDMDAFRDFNGDGTVDWLATGYRGNEEGNWMQGMTRVVSGTDGSTLAEIEGGQFEEFGRDATSLGDVNGDGISDFAVMGLDLNHNWQSTPRVRIFDGSDATEITRVEGDIASFFVVNIYAVNDLDADGRDEVVIAISDDQIGGGTQGFEPGGEIYLVGVTR
ncbi:MAG: hypothetical protein ACPG31_10955 [Planctomycetota bacterium]